MASRIRRQQIVLTLALASLLETRLAPGSVKTPKLTNHLKFDVSLSSFVNISFLSHIALSTALPLRDDRDLAVMFANLLQRTNHSEACLTQTLDPVCPATQ